MKLGTNNISSVYLGTNAVQKVYLGTNEVWTSFTGLLDDYPNAAAAYSLRLLRSAYTGSAIRVRRASDNTEQDIGFVNNELDTSTLTSFCSGTNGFVTTWYDQSGNGNDATQTTAANQPQIVSSGSVITMSSKPSLETSTSSLRPSTALTPTDFSIIHVNEGSGFIANIGDYIRISTYLRYRIGATDYIATDSLAAQKSIFIGNRNGTTLNLRRNNYEMIGSPFTSVSTALDIDTIMNRTSLFFVGKVSEFIIYESSQSSNFNGIETNINDFYSIY